MGLRVRRGAAVVLAGALITALPIVDVGSGLEAGAGASSPALTPSTTSLSFEDTTLGNGSDPQDFYLTNDSAGYVSLDLSTEVSFSGPGADDYFVMPPGYASGIPTRCTLSGSIVTFAPGASCDLNVYFYPDGVGDRSATMTIQGAGPMYLSGTGTIGYYQVDSRGHVAHTADAGYFGDTGNTNLNEPIVGMAATGANNGYWLVASDGGIFAYGDAPFWGSAGSIHLNKPIVGMALSFHGLGYYLLASDGGIFTYGDAQFYGSAGAINLNKPIVGMAPTNDGGGYWLVASDGGIFAYGDANFYGSTGAIHLNKPVVGMAATGDDRGYWLVASDGGIFTYGDALFYGSAGALDLAQPIVAMAAMPTGGGYWLSAADGGLFNYGDAPFDGSGVGTALGQVVDMTSNGVPTMQAVAGIPGIRQTRVSGLSPNAFQIQHFAGP